MTATAPPTRRAILPLDIKSSLTTCVERLSVFCWLASHGSRPSMSSAARSRPTFARRDDVEHEVRRLVEHGEQRHEARKVTLDLERSRGQRLRSGKLAQHDLVEGAAPH